MGTARADQRPGRSPCVPRRRLSALRAAVPAVMVLTSLLLLLAGCTDEPTGAGPAPTQAPSPPQASSPPDPDGAGVPLIADASPDRPAWEPLLEPGVGGQVTDLSFDPHDPDRVLVGGDMLGIGLSTDGGRTWRPAMGLTGWEIGAITWHPEREGEVWAGTMSGPQVSFDGGETWERRRDGFPPMSDTSYSAPIERILIDPADGDRLLAFGGSKRRWASPGEPLWGRVWESTDGGGRWRALADLGPDEILSDATFLADGETALVSSYQGGVFRSTDAGRTWQPSSNGLPHGVATSVEADPIDPDVAWATLDATEDGQTGGVFRTSDGGVTWSRSDAGLSIQSGPTRAETSRFTALTVSPSEPDVVYTADLASNVRNIYRSDDGGSTWVRVPAGAAAFYATDFSAYALAVAPDDPDRVLAAQEESIFATEDGGQNWVDVGVVPQAEGYRGTGYSGLVGTSVRLTEDGVVAIQALDGGALLVRRPDGSWHAPLRDWDPRGGGYDVSITDDTWWALLGQQGVFNGVARSGDNGLTWDVRVGGDLPERGVHLDTAPHTILGLSDRAALVTFDGALHRTVNGGESWIHVTDQVQFALASAPDDRRTVFGAGPDGVFRSDDGGRSFELLPGSPRDVQHLTMGGDGRLFASVHEGADAGAWLFDGRAWELVLAHPQVSEVAVDPRDDQHLLVATRDEPSHDEPRSLGVIESFDGGRTWSRLDHGLAVTRVTTVAFAPSGSGLVIAGTAGGGFYQLRDE